MWSICRITHLGVMYLKWGRIVVPGMLVELGPDVVAPKAIKKTAPKVDRRGKKLGGTCNAWRFSRQICRNK